MTTTDTPTRKAHVLTPAELEQVDALSAALIGKAAAEAAVIVQRKEIGRLTQAINKGNFDEAGKYKGGVPRSVVIWAEARAKLGAPPAPTREQLSRGT